MIFRKSQFYFKSCFLHFWKQREELHRCVRPWNTLWGVIGIHTQKSVLMYYIIGPKWRFFHHSSYFSSNGSKWTLALHSSFHFYVIFKSILFFIYLNIHIFKWWLLVDMISVSSVLVWHLNFMYYHSNIHIFKYSYIQIFKWQGLWYIWYDAEVASAVVQL